MRNYRPPLTPEVVFTRGPPMRSYSKYRSSKTKYGGRTYDSRAEAARAEQLDIHMRAGRARYWQPQVTFPLGDDSLRVDFLVWWPDGVIEAEDVKGYETADFKRKKNLWGKYAPCALRILRRRGDKWTVEVVEGKHESGREDE